MESSLQVNSYLNNHLRAIKDIYPDPAKIEISITLQRFIECLCQRFFIVYEILYASLDRSERFIGENYIVRRLKNGF